MKENTNAKGIKDKSENKPYQKSISGKPLSEKECNLEQNQDSNTPNVTSIETAEKVESREENY